jgi:methionyl-tRNA formyltransferase
MKIIFAGTPANAASSLEALVSKGLNIVGVLTREDSRVGRSQTLQESAVSEVASRLGLEIYKSNKFSVETRNWLTKLGADVGVIVAYGSILRDEELEIPRLGWLNLHYSLLPEFPGPAPVQHAILNGKKSTGVTLFRLDEGIDTGAIIGSVEKEIEPDENSADLLLRLTVLGNNLLFEALNDLESRISLATPQPRGASFSVAYKPTRALAKLDFTESTGQLRQKVLAMNPEPMAWFEYDGLAVRVLESTGTNLEGQGIGELSLREKKLVAGCSDGAIELLLVQPSGKKPMSGADWFRGLRKDSIELN